MKNFLLSTLLILATLVGCKKQPEIGSNLLVITAVKSDFDTKATETAFEVGDKIGLYVNENVGNLPYETLDGTSWKCLGFLNEFLAGKDYYATAYYPFSESTKDATAIEVGNGIDFMVSAKTKLDIANNTASGTLQFKHVLSKLVANIDMPEEIDGIKTVSLDSIIVRNVFRKATINLATGVISGLTDKGDIVVKNGEAIIIPQTVSRIEFVFKMASGGFSKLAYIKGVALESGKKTTLNAHSNADLYFASILDLKSGEAQTNLPLSIYVATGRKWTLKSSETWLTFSKTSGIGKGLETITASVKVNSAYPLKPRAVTLTLADDKPSKTTLKTQQNCTRIPTVEIAGTNWTMGNLTGTTQGQTSGFTVCPNPQDYGMFWKWGSLFMYNHVSGDVPDTHWDKANLPADYSRWAATYPITQSYGYDFINLSSTWGAPVGDPCNALGTYRTPTKTQWEALVAAGHSGLSTYQGVNGCFFGGKASICNNAEIKDGCIFIPMAGMRVWDSGLLESEKSAGYYWSSSIFNDGGGFECSFRMDAISTDDRHVRGCAFSVRCIAE